MMNWLTNLLFGLLKGLYARYKNDIVEEAFAKHSAEVLKMTTIGDKLLHEVEEMHDEELDDFLKELGK